MANEQSFDQIEFRRVPITAGQPELHTVAVFTCVGCSVEEHISMSARLPPSVIIDKLRQRGWVTNKRGGDRRCTICKNASKAPNPDSPFSVLQKVVRPVLLQEPPIVLPKIPPLVEAHIPDEPPPAPIMQPSPKPAPELKSQPYELINEPLPVLFRTVVKQADGVQIAFERMAFGRLVTLTELVRLRETIDVLNIGSWSWTVSEIGLVPAETDETCGRIVVRLNKEKWRLLHREPDLDLSHDGWRAVSRPPAAFVPQAQHVEAPPPPAKPVRKTKMPPWVSDYVKPVLALPAGRANPFTVSEVSNMSMFTDRYPNEATRFSMAGILMRYLRETEQVLFYKQGLTIMHYLPEGE